MACDAATRTYCPAPEFIRVDNHLLRREEICAAELIGAKGDRPAQLSVQVGRGREDRRFVTVEGAMAAAAWEQLVAHLTAP